MKITLHLNHGATEVHKSWLISLSVSRCQHPRAWGAGQEKSPTWSLGILRAGLSSSLACSLTCRLLSKEIRALPAEQLLVTQDEQVELKDSTETHL